MKDNTLLPDHFFTRELLILPLEAGKENLIGTGTLQHKDRVSLRTINYQSNEYSGVLLFQGKGYYEDDNGMVTPLKRGSFFQRFPGRIHSTYPNKEGRWSEFYITLPSPLSEALIKTGFINDTPVRNTVIDEKLMKTMVTIKEFFRNDDRIEAAAILPLIMDFLFLIRRPESGNNRPAGPTAGDERFMQLFHNRLRSQTSYALNIRELCREQGIGYEGFRKKFKTKNGISPGSYAVRFRIDEACRRMKNGQMQIKEIALDLGYPDLAAFSRQFSRIKGASPRRWLSNQIAI